MNDKTGTRIVEVGTVGVPVSDQDRALQFYVGTLGFEKRRDVPFGEGRRWVEVAPCGASTTVALVAARDDVPSGVETGIRFFTENVEADHEYLHDHGVDVDAEIMRFGGYVPPMFYFRDPDGNRLVIVERA